MQESRLEPVLLMLTGIGPDGRMAWMFVPAKWDVPAVERHYDFSGKPGDTRRKAAISVDQARELVRRYGASSLMPQPGEPCIEDLLAEQLSMVKMLIVRDQEAAFSAMPL